MPIEIADEVKYLLALSRLAIRGFKRILLDIIDDEISDIGRPGAILFSHSLTALIEVNNQFDILEREPRSLGLEAKKTRPAENSEVNRVEGIIAVQQFQRLANAVGAIRRALLLDARDGCGLG